MGCFLAAEHLRRFKSLCFLVQNSDLLKLFLLCMMNHFATGKLLMTNSLMPKRKSIHLPYLLTSALRLAGVCLSTEYPRCHWAKEGYALDN